MDLRQFDLFFIERGVFAAFCDNHGICFRVLRRDIEWFAGGRACFRELEIRINVPLANRIKFRSKMFADGDTRGRDERATMFGNLLFEKFKNVDYAQKADPLRILLVRCRQFCFPRDLPHLRLQIIPYREQAMSQGFLI